MVALPKQGDAAVEVADGTELTEFVGRCLADESFRDELGKNAQAIVQQQLGAAGRTVDALESLLVEPARTRSAAA